MSDSLRLGQRKLSRLLKYLQFRDYKSKLLKTVEDEDSQTELGTIAVTHIHPLHPLITEVKNVIAKFKV